MASKLHKEGVTFIGDLLRDNTTTPASYYLRLAKDTNLADTDGLADVTECDAPGYAAQAVASDTTDLTLSDYGTNDVQLQTSLETFSFSGSGDDVSMWYLATSSDNSGKLIASGTLDGAPITPAAAGTHTVRATIQITTPDSGAKLHKEGATFIADLLRDNATTPASYYVGLAKDASLADTAALTDIDECDAAGYSRQAVASDTTDIALSDYGTNDVKIVTTEETHSFTEDGDDVNMWFLATTSDNSGKLLASGSLTGAPVPTTDGGSTLTTVTLQLTTP